MGWISAAAVFFIIWWTVLFAILPIGLRTQEDASDVTLGTVSSAPNGRHMGRVVILTTIVSIAVFGALYVLTRIYGFGVDDLPNFLPDFSQPKP